MHTQLLDLHVGTHVNGLNGAKLPQVINVCDKKKDAAV